MYAKQILACISGMLLMVSLSGCGDNNQNQSQAGTATSPVEYSATIEPKDLQGNWVAGTGKAMFEMNADGSLKITNESGMIASGKISGDTLAASDWNVTGRLSKDKKTFIWSNGAAWKK